jgi:hypothetical protein
MEFVLTAFKEFEKSFYFCQNLKTRGTPVFSQILSSEEKICM